MQRVAFRRTRRQAGNLLRDVNKLPLVGQLRWFCRFNSASDISRDSGLTRGAAILVSCDPERSSRGSKFALPNRQNLVASPPSILHPEGASAISGITLVSTACVSLARHCSSWLATHFGFVTVALSSCFYFLHLRQLLNPPTLCIHVQTCLKGLSDNNIHNYIVIYHSNIPFIDDGFGACNIYESRVAQYGEHASPKARNLITTPCNAMR